MISLTSIITAIKGASIATKIGLSVGAVVVVVGGTVGTVMIINNTNKTPENQQIASEDQNDDNSPSEQNSTQNEDTGEPEDDKDKTDQNNQPVDESKPNDTNINNGSQATTQKPNSNTSNQSTSNNYSASKPSNSTPAQPSQPSQPTQPAKKPDYNLNDKYVAGYYTYPIFTYDPNGPDLQKCKVVEEKAFFGVGKFTGSPSLYAVAYPQFLAYAKSKGYDDYTNCGGMGAGLPITWQDAINMGIALDEAKCKQYGLSCGRW